MQTYCVSCRKNTENKSAKVTQTKNGSVCGNKESRFVKEQETKGILSSLGIKTTLSKIPGINILF